MLIGGDPGGAERRGVRIQLEPWPSAFEATRFTQVFRYEVYADYLEQSGGLFDTVAVSDAADVAFQTNPFDAVRPTDGLVFGMDKDLIGHSRGNKYCLGNLYGKPTAASLGPRNVGTSGFTMGRRLGMLRYLRRMAGEVRRLVVPRLPVMDKENWMLAKGYDQGIHIWLLYNEFLAPPVNLSNVVAVRILKYDDVYISGAARMQLMRDVSLNGGVLRNLRNDTIAVVHQWNRMQWAVQHTLRCQLPSARTTGSSTRQADYCTECYRNWRTDKGGSTLLTGESAPRSHERLLYVGS